MIRSLIQRRKLTKIARKSPRSTLIGYSEVEHERALTRMLQDMGIPPVRLGPGGDYTRDYLREGSQR